MDDLTATASPGLDMEALGPALLSQLTAALPARGAGPPPAAAAALLAGSLRRARRVLTASWMSLAAAVRSLDPAAAAGPPPPAGLAGPPSRDVVDLPREVFKGVAKNTAPARTGLDVIRVRYAVDTGLIDFLQQVTRHGSPIP